MKLWISKSSEVPIQEQLVTQLILGIVSADLAGQEKLPSTTQLGRRFKIHPNTVRAAYRELADRGWVEWRAGSGFYVRSRNGHQKMDPSLDLDHLISTFIDIARRRGFPLAEIQKRIGRWLAIQEPDHVVVIEPDPELRAILVSEISDHVTQPVTGVDISNVRKDVAIGALCVALNDHEEELRKSLPPEYQCLFLRSRSIAKSLAAESKPSPDTIITVISRWPDFLNWARTTLVAVGIDATALDLRDAREKHWERGLTSKSFIVTDHLTGRNLPPRCRARTFQVISDKSLNELCNHFSAPALQGKNAHG